MNETRSLNGIINIGIVKNKRTKRLFADHSLCYENIKLNFEYTLPAGCVPKMQTSAIHYYRSTRLIVARLKCYCYHHPYRRMSVAQNELKQLNRVNLMLSAKNAFG